MSCKLLGESFDIHAGGHDLIFPHHENEIAQSEAANEKPFAKYWLHFGFLNINEEKMSKSLGNFFTAREILKKYSAEAIRLFFAQAHYRGPLNFSDELLQAAEKGVEKIQNLADKLNEQLSKSAEGEKVNFNFEQWYKKFEEAMDDDFNSAQASAVLFDFTREVNRVIAENENPDKEFYTEAKSFLKKTGEDVLGIVNFETKESLPSLENDLIDLLIKIRTEAKQNKNYALSDKIRDELNKLGVILQDTKEGTSYKKVKK